MKTINIENYFGMSEITKNCEKCNDGELFQKELIDLANNGMDDKFNIKQAQLNLFEAKEALFIKVSRIFAEGAANINNPAELTSAKLSKIRRYALIRDLKI